jgi:hypothetical protein
MPLSVKSGIVRTCADFACVARANDVAGALLHPKIFGTRPRGGIMFRSYKCAHVFRMGYRQILVALSACLLFSGSVTAQQLPPAASRTEIVPPAPSTPSEHGPYVLATNDVNAFVDPLAGSAAGVAPAAPGVQDSTAPSNAPTSTSVESNWHLTVAPYLWIPWAYGSVGANGNNVRFYATPGELFSHFRFGLLGLVDTRYKRVVLPLDMIWLRLGADRALPLSPNGTVANVKLDIFILTSKVGYRVIDTKKVKIDALAGFRYWHGGQNLQFTTNTLNFSGSQNWVDPLVGGRILGNLSPKVEIAIGGDVGGWGTGSQLDYSVGGFLGYRIKPSVALQAGYRYLAVDYTNGNRLLNLINSGPLFGVTIALK